MTEKRILGQLAPDMIKEIQDFATSPILKDLERSNITQFVHEATLAIRLRCSIIDVEDVEHYKTSFLAPLDEWAESHNCTWNLEITDNSYSGTSAMITGDALDRVLRRKVVNSTNFGERESDNLSDDFWEGLDQIHALRMLEDANK